MNPVTADTPAVATTPFVIRVLGVGGAGSRLARALARQEASVTARAVDTDILALGQLDGVPAVLIGDSIQRGLGCGGDAIQAATLAEMDPVRLKEAVHGAGLVLLVVGLGGGAGSGIAPVAARLARESGALVVALAALPFEFEGRLRRANATHGLTALRGVADLVIPIPHQGILRAVDSALAGDLLRCADGYVLEVGLGLIRMLTCQPLIPLGLADLTGVLRGCQAEGVAAATETTGEHRVREAWDQLSRHPFLASPTALLSAGAIIIQVAGGSDLSTAELESLGQMAGQSAPRASVLLGAVTHPSLDGRLSVLLVAVPASAVPSDGPSMVTRSEEVPPIAASPSPDALQLEDPAAPSGANRGWGEVGSSERRGAGSSRSRSSGRTLQQQFNFGPRWRSRFEGVEGTIRHGENLDEPTFARKGVKLN